MIFGTGIDLIDIQRIKKSLETKDDSFCQSLFTETEIQYCKRTNNLNVQSQCFAARFAAKEAFFKAIGTGLRNGLQWKDVEVINDDLGKPSLHLKNKAFEMIHSEAIDNIQLSVSHDKTHATAIVILERSETP